MNTCDERNAHYFCLRSFTFGHFTQLLRRCSEEDVVQRATRPTHALTNSLADGSRKLCGVVNWICFNIFQQRFCTHSDCCPTIAIADGGVIFCQLIFDGHEFSGDAFDGFFCRYTFRTRRCLP